MASSVIVVGAGMAGLTAARRLTAAGLMVHVLDKGRAVGGRMATRRVGAARFDHGAQHFSVRTPAFADEVAGLERSHHARVWLRTRSLTRPERGVEERWVGVDGMRGVPEALAAGLHVTTACAVETIGVEGGRVLVRGPGTVLSADALVLTPPLPQTLALLGTAGLDDRVPVSLRGVEYDAALAVLAVLDGPTGLHDGHLALADGAVAWLADNQHKGVSAVPAVTIHSSAGFAAANLDRDPSDWVGELIAAARPHLGATVSEAVGHRWRYARPRTTRSDGAVAIDAAVPVVLAGEVFAGARVEGAFTSGIAAAAMVQSMLP